jgi:hypothetical protein
VSALKLRGTTKKFSTVVMFLIIELQQFTHTIRRYAYCLFLYQNRMPKLIASLASYELKSKTSHRRNVILHRTNVFSNLHIFPDLLRYIIPGHRISDPVTPT